MEKGSFPKNPTMSRKLKRNVNYYVIEGGDLYRKGFRTLLLKCLTRNHVEYMMNKMHKGIFEMHLGSQLMTAQVLSVGYYWPTMRRDKIEYLKNAKNLETYITYRMKNYTM